MICISGNSFCYHILCITLLILIDIRPNASLPVKSSLPSANSGFGPKSSVPATRPHNAFGNGPVPPPPPRESGAGVIKATPRPSKYYIRNRFSPNLREKRQKTKKTL